MSTEFTILRGRRRLRDPQTLSHPLAGLSGHLFDNGYVLPVAERLLADPAGWTATALATALDIQGSNKVRGALARLEAADLVKTNVSDGRGKLIRIVDAAHPFWTFVSSLASP
jgi:hypothetical protein